MAVGFDILQTPASLTNQEKTQADISTLDK
jgi:hypothetical protein